MALNLTIKVENAYSDGHESEQTHAVTLDRFRGEEDLWDHLFEYTGDGHGDGRDLGSLYTVTVLARPPSLTATARTTRRSSWRAVLTDILDIAEF